MLKTVTFRTSKNVEMVNITEQVRAVVASEKVQEGLCIVYSQHTTAGITLNATSDPATAQDVLDALDRVAPMRVDYKHTLDTPADAAGHIKIALVGNSALVPIQDGDLHLGHSQSVLFCEFDGPRDREFQVQILRET